MKTLRTYTAFGVEKETSNDIAFNFKAHSIRGAERQAKRTMASFYFVGIGDMEAVSEDEVKQYLETNLPRKAGTEG